MYQLDEDKLALINNPSPAGLLVINIERAENIVAGIIIITTTIIIIIIL